MNTSLFFLLLNDTLDGWLDIPHSHKRFAGFNNENKQLVDAETTSMVVMSQTHFSAYNKIGFEADSI